ncbi:MAG: acyl carrier protein [Muricoprocola sp.]
MLEKIRELIVNEVGVEPEEVTLEANFKEDLHIDSLDLFELVMAFEENFGVEIPNEDLEQITTVGSLIEYIENHKAE